MTKKKSLTNGRRKALDLLSKMGNRFHKSTALKKLTDSEVINPESKWDCLLLRGSLKHIEGDIYEIAKK